MPLVAVVALSLGAVLMWKVHQFSAPPPVITVLPPQAPPEFSPKRVTYELSGSIGEGGMLVWADVNGHPHRVNLTTLPWKYTPEPPTTLTVVSASISAQVRGSGQLGCRILVNGVVRAEQSDTHQDAHVFCLVKSA
jgi:hypothetical protein